MFKIRNNKSFNRFFKTNCCLLLLFLCKLWAINCPKRGVVRMKYSPKLTKRGNQGNFMNVFNFYLGKTQISISFINIFLLERVYSTSKMLLKTLQTFIFKLIKYLSFSVSEYYLQILEKLYSSYYPENH